MAKSVVLVPREALSQYPQASFMTAQEQSTYEEACSRFKGKAKESLNISLNGLNLWKILLLNQEGVRTATLQELDLIADIDPQFLEGFYADAPAVALRSASDSYNSNDYVAKQLAKLIKRKSFPHTVIVEGLGIKSDSRSSYGLSFVKTERLKVIEAPDFDRTNNERRFSRINPDYTIEFDERGAKTLYTGDNGISRLDLYRLNVGSDSKNLAGPGEVGRVVRVANVARSRAKK